MPLFGRSQMPAGGVVAVVRGVVVGPVSRGARDAGGGGTAGRPPCPRTKERKVDVGGEHEKGVVFDVVGDSEAVRG